ncbi:MAG: SRPBCC domain-containing protein [Herpetosiphon sp.]
MKEFHATGTIAATPEVVWSILTNATAYPEWDPSAERIEGRIALGEKIKAFTKLSPGRAFPVTVSEFEVGRKMVWSGGLPLGLFRGVRTFTLNPDGNGTTEFSIREVFSGPLLPVFGRSLPDMTAVFEQFVAGLKRRAEMGDTGSAQLH